MSLPVSSRGASGGDFWFTGFHFQYIPSNWKKAGVLPSFRVDKQIEQGKYSLI